MFLAHLARHLMQTASHSRLLDIQYLLLSLPGAVLALLPLWPDFSWLGRFLPLWPMLALIFVPTTLGAWLMGVPGAAVSCWAASWPHWGPGWPSLTSGRCSRPSSRAPCLCGGRPSAP